LVVRRWGGDCARRARRGADRVEGVDTVGKIKAILKKIAGGAKSAVKYGAKRAPLLSALLTGGALAFPAAGPVLGFIASLLSGQASTGQVATDPALAAAIRDLIAGAPLLGGSLYKYWLLARKTWALAKPLLNPPADAAPGK
jgi:hypothetical protein